VHAGIMDLRPSGRRRRHLTRAIMKLAFFGPLPPSTTGIADYDAALLPLLRNDYEIDVFVQEKCPGAHSHADFYSRNLQYPYDLCLYQMGNSPFHEYVYGYLFQNPGAVVFHDTCLLHSRSEMLLKRQMTEEYRNELRAVYPEHAEEIANAIIPSAAGDALFYQFPLFELVLRSSLAAATHTHFAAKQLSISETPVVTIPHLTLKGGNDSKREEYRGKFVIASFGYVTKAKRIDLLLQAVAEIRTEFESIFCVIVGDIEDRVQLDRDIQRFGLNDSVSITGRVDLQDFLGWMGRADAIVNLRFPSAGEMSGTLIRALATGKPVIISRLQSLQEIPDDAALRVRPDYELSDLKQALSNLLRNSNLRRQLSAKAQNYIHQNHTPQAVRERYGKLIQTAIDRKSQFRTIELPLHLQSAKHILNSYLRNSVFKNLHLPTAFLNSI
jgi:glycosyltransferase involved in cell wall biosynthesis